MVLVTTLHCAAFADDLSLRVGLLGCISSSLFDIS